MLQFSQPKKSRPTWLTDAPSDFRAFRRKVLDRGSLDLQDSFHLVCRRMNQLLQEPESDTRAKYLRHAIEALEETRKRRLPDHKLPVALWTVARSTSPVTAVTVAGILHEAIPSLRPGPPSRGRA